MNAAIGAWNTSHSGSEDEQCPYQFDSTGKLVRQP